MFVDDAYLIHAATKPNVSSSELKNIVQYDLNKWNEGFHFSGGYLNGEKKLFYHELEISTEWHSISG